MGDLPDFGKGRIVGALLAGASLTKTLLGVSRASVSKVMWAYTNHEKRHYRRGTVGES
jgi:hypothetical protein